MPIALYALALAAFAIGTTEFIVSGILPAISADLDVSIPTAGLLVTGYAGGVAIGGPILAMFSARFPPKPMIVGLMLIFALGQVLCALAPDFTLLLGARLVSAAGHGVFFGVASVAAAKLVQPEKSGAALSLFVGGITVANILGLPGGTAIGNAFGWRVSFVCIAGLALLAAVAIVVTMPGQKGDRVPDAPMRQQFAQLRHQQVFATYAVITVIMVGALAFGTFQVPILLDVTGVDPAHVPFYLLGSGAGAVFGIWLGGRLADWNLMPSLVGVILAQAATNVLLLVAVHDPVAMAFAMVVYGIFGFAFSTPSQVRILKAARAAPNLASTLISTAYNIGIAAGALLGATLLTGGLDYALLPVVGIVCSTIAALIAIGSWLAERRSPVPA